MRRLSPRKPSLRRRVAAKLSAALAGLFGPARDGRPGKRVAGLAAPRVRASRFPRLGESRRRRAPAGGDFAPVSFGNLGGGRAAFPEE